MLVPIVVAASTSPSPANVPPVIATVALTSVRLSGSDTNNAGDTVTVGWVTATNAVTLESAGGLLTATMLMVSLAVAMLLLAVPSLTVHWALRVGPDP